MKQNNNLVNKLNNRITKMNNNVRSAVQDQLVINTIRVLLIIYCAFVVPMLKQNHVNAVNQPVVRFIVVVFIVYASFIDMVTAVLLSIALLVTLNRSSNNVSSNNKSNNVINNNNANNNVIQDLESNNEATFNKAVNNIMQQINHISGNQKDNFENVNNGPVDNDALNNALVNGGNDALVNGGNDALNNALVNGGNDALNNALVNGGNDALVNGSNNALNNLIGNTSVTNTGNEVGEVMGNNSQGLTGESISELAQQQNNKTINDSGDIPVNNIPNALDNSPVNNLQVFDGANNAEKKNNINVEKAKNNNEVIDQVNIEQPASETLTEGILRAQGAQKNMNAPKGLTTGNNLYSIQENAVPGANIMDEITTYQNQHSTQNLGKPMGHKAKRYQGHHYVNENHPNLKHAMLRNENL